MACLLLIVFVFLFCDLFIYLFGLPQGGVVWATSQLACGHICNQSVLFVTVVEDCHECAPNESALKERPVEEVAARLAQQDQAEQDILTGTDPRRLHTLVLCIYSTEWLCLAFFDSVKPNTRYTSTMMTMICIQYMASEGVFFCIHLH